MPTIIHIFTEKEALQTFKLYIQSRTKNEQYESFLLEDRLDIGKLRFEHIPYSAGRNAFYQEITQGENEGPAGDLERLMEVSTRLSNFPETEVCFWIGNNAKDVCAYYWLLHFLRKHAGKLSLISISGLPFLNEDNQLFYPKMIREISGHEMEKALYLRNTISPSQWETDGEEWSRLREENKDIRILRERRRLESQPANYYDDDLMKLCNSLKEPTRVTTIIRKIKEEKDFDFPDFYLKFRLNYLSQNGLLCMEEGKVRPISKEQAQ